MKPPKVHFSIWELAIWTVAFATAWSATFWLGENGLVLSFYGIASLSCWRLANSVPPLVALILCILIALTATAVSVVILHN